MRLYLVCATAAALVVTPFDTVHSRTVSAAQGSLSEDEVQRLLAEPTRIAVSGQLADARSKFEAVLSDARQHHGAASLQAADLLATFGLFLIGSGFMPGHEAQQKIGQKYLRDAVSAYRAALGSSHPAVANALQVEAAFLADDPSPEAEALLDEALKIRLRLWVRSIPIRG